MRGGSVRFAATVSMSELAGLRRGTRVRVVWPEAWVQTLELSSQRVQGVSEDTLASLLAYEAETFSGLSPESSALAYRRLAAKGGVTQYLTMQLPLSEIDGIRRALRERGLVLAGVTHPRMLEFGEDAPTVVPPPEPRTLRDDAKAALVAALAAVALCAGAHFVQSAAVGRLAERVAAVEGEQARCRAAEEDAQRLRRERQALERRLAEEVERPLARLRARRGYARILDALAEARPEGGMISAIESEGDYTLGIRGITTTSEEAECYLKDLGERLQTNGFAVATLSLASMNQLPGGGPWAFRCRITQRPGEEAP